MEEGADHNLLGNNNPAHINSNIKIDIKVKSKPDEDMTGGNLYKKNSEINIEDLFQ